MANSYWKEHIIKNTLESKTKQLNIKDYPRGLRYTFGESRWGSISCPGIENIGFICTRAFITKPEEENKVTVRLNY